MALPNDKISIPMVARELGTTENDLGRLCTHRNFNKWAKFKPIDHPKIADLTKQDYISENYGIDIVASLGEYSNPKALYDMVVSLGRTHRYKKPLGGQLSPYRLGDFREYQNAPSLPPISTGVTSQPVRVYDTYPMPYGGVEPQPEQFLLSRGVLYPNTPHRGILLVNETLNRSFWTTGKVDWTEIRLRTWRGDSIKAFEFMVTTRSINQNGVEVLLTGGSNRFDSIGGTPNDFYAVISDGGYLNPYTLNFPDLGGGTDPVPIRYTSSLNAIYNYSTNKVDYTLTFYSNRPNTTGGALQKVQVALFVNGERDYITQHGDFTLPNNSQKVYTGSFNASPILGMQVFAYENSRTIEQSSVLITT